MPNPLFEILNHDLSPNTPISIVLKNLEESKVFILSSEYNEKYLDIFVINSLNKIQDRYTNQIYLPLGYLYLTLLQYYENP